MLQSLNLALEVGNQINLRLVLAQHLGSDLVLFLSKLVLVPLFILCNFALEFTDLGLGFHLVQFHFVSESLYLLLVLDHKLRALILFYQS